MLADAADPKEEIVSLSAFSWAGVNAGTIKGAMGSRLSEDCFALVASCLAGEGAGVITGAGVSTFSAIWFPVVESMVGGTREVSSRNAAPTLQTPKSVPGGTWASPVAFTDSMSSSLELLDEPDDEERFARLPPPREIGDGGLAAFLEAVAFAEFGASVIGKRGASPVGNKAADALSFRAKRFCTFEFLNLFLFAALFEMPFPGTSSDKDRLAGSTGLHFNGAADLPLPFLPFITAPECFAVAIGLAFPFPSAILGVLGELAFGRGNTTLGAVLGRMIWFPAPGPLFNCKYLLFAGRKMGVPVCIGHLGSAPIANG